MLKRSSFSVFIPTQGTQATEKGPIDLVAATYRRKKVIPLSKTSEQKCDRWKGRLGLRLQTFWAQVSSLCKSPLRLIWKNKNDTKKKKPNQNLSSVIYTLSDKLL